MGLSLPGGLFNLPLGDRSACAKGDGCGNSTREEEDVRLNGGNLTAQAIQAPLAYVHAVNKQLATGGVKGAVEQFGQRTFAGARLAHNSNRLPRFDMEGKI